MITSIFKTGIRGIFLLKNSLIDANLKRLYDFGGGGCMSPFYAMTELVQTAQPKNLISQT